MRGLQLHEKPGGESTETADLNCPKGHPTPYDSMKSHKRWGKLTGGLPLLWDWLGISQQGGQLVSSTSFFPDSLPHLTRRGRGSKCLNIALLPAGLNCNTKCINHRYYWPFSKHQVVQETIPPSCNFVLCLGCQNDTIWAVAVMPAYTIAMGRPALFLPLSAHTASRAHTACRLPTMEYPNAGHRAAYTKLHAPQETRGSSTQQGRHQWKGSTSARHLSPCTGTSSQGSSEAAARQAALSHTAYFSACKSRG